MQKGLFENARLPDGLEQIGAMNAAMSDMFKKSLQAMADKKAPNKMLATGKVITNTLPSGTDVSIELGSFLKDGCTMAFLVTPKELNALKRLGGKQDAVILDETWGDYYSVHEGNITIPLPKVRQKVCRAPIHRLPTGGDMGSAVPVTDSKRLLSLVKGYSYIDLLIYDNQLLKFSTPDQTVYMLDPLSADQYHRPADLILRSYDFLKVPGNEPSFRILLVNGSYWLYTKMTIGVGVTAALLENVSRINNRLLL